MKYPEFLSPGLFTDGEGTFYVCPSQFLRGQLSPEAPIITDEVEVVCQMIVKELGYLGIKRYRFQDPALN